MHQPAVPTALFDPSGQPIWANDGWRLAFAGCPDDALGAAVASAPLADYKGECSPDGQRKVLVEAVSTGFVATLAPDRPPCEEVGMALRSLVHELNNHLHVSASVAEMLSEVAQVDPEDEVLLTDLMGSCRRAVRLAEQLRAVGRALSEPADSVDVSALLDDASLGWPTDSQVMLVIESSSVADQQLRCEAVVAQQALDNLLSEARAAASAGSSVMVTGRAGGGTLRLRFDTLTDTDADELRQHVDEPFARQASGRLHSGTEIGLARLLVRLIGGDLSFEAPVPRRARWTLTLPTA